jgi:hypothetical protein
MQQMLAIVAMLELQKRRQKRQQKQQARLKNYVDRPAHRRTNRQRRSYRDLTAITPHRQSFTTAPRAHPAPVQLPAAARIICRSPPIIIENVAATAETTPPLPMDDIDHAYGEECASIRREFAQRMAGARNQGERRAIKSARKSALAAAKEKAKQAKAARQAANAAQRPARPPPHPRPEPRPG